MHIYLGSYTEGRSSPGIAKGAGITHALFDPRTGCITKVAEYSQAINPSWLHADPDGRHLYVASERSDGPGDVHSFEICADGALRHLSQQSSHGLATCHLTTTADRLFAASYVGGRLTGFPLCDGVIQPCDQQVDYEGSGPNEARQASPHAHQATVSPNGRWLYVCDLGSDRVHIHPATMVTEAPMTSIEVPAGAGPRHMVFHPDLPLLYVWCELEPLLLEMVWDSTTGDVSLRRVHNLREHVGEEPVGEGASIHLHPSGRWLGVSERTGSSVCLFSVAEDGAAAWAERSPVAGETPRDFAFSPDGKWLLVAYQDTHLVAVYAMDDQGRIALSPEARFETGLPVCLCMIGE